jgi:hypothetical protein
LGVRERDERALEARAAQEPHRCRIELRRALTRDQDEQSRSIVEVDVRQVRRCCAPS